MKIRVTLMAENDEYLDDSVSKEEIENLTTMAWQLAMDMLKINSGSDDSVTYVVEACELISRD